MKYLIEFYIENLKVENAEKKEVELKMKAENGTLQTENDNLKVS